MQPVFWSHHHIQRLDRLNGSRPSPARKSPAKPARRRSLQPLSPIQNNSDLAQGLLPIRPSTVRHDGIYLAPGGDTWSQLGSHMSSGWFSR